MLLNKSQALFEVKSPGERWLDDRSALLVNETPARTDANACQPFAKLTGFVESGGNDQLARWIDIATFVVFL